MPKKRLTKSRIESITVVPPQGQLRTAIKAIAFIESLDEQEPGDPFTRFEVGVRYNNGNEIRGQFSGKVEAVAFLKRVR